MVQEDVAKKKGVGEAQKRARKKYMAEKCRQMNVKFYPADEDMWEWMTSNGYRGSWIRSLIRREYEAALEDAGRAEEGE